MAYLLPWFFTKHTCSKRSGLALLINVLQQVVKNKYSTILNQCTQITSHIIKYRLSTVSILSKPRERTKTTWTTPKQYYKQQHINLCNNSLINTNADQRLLRYLLVFQYNNNTIIHDTFMWRAFVCPWSYPLTPLGILWRRRIDKRAHQSVAFFASIEKALFPGVS